MIYNCESNGWHEQRTKRYRRAVACRAAPELWASAGMKREARARSELERGRLKGKWKVKQGRKVSRDNNFGLGRE